MSHRARARRDYAALTPVNPLKPERKMKRNSPFRANSLSHPASPVIEMALQAENAQPAEDPKPENRAGVSFSPASH